MERKCSVLWKWFDLLNWTPISCRDTPSQQLELNTWLSSISSDRYCWGLIYKYIAYSWINNHTIQNDPLLFQTNESNFNFPPTNSAPYKLSASAPTRLLYGFKFTITTKLLAFGQTSYWYRDHGGTQTCSHELCRYPDARTACRIYLHIAKQMK